MKVADLTGALLDYWAAKIAPQCAGCGIAYIADHATGPHYIGSCADGVAFFIPTTGIAQVLRLKREYDATAWRPHIDWSQAGPIIEREKIDLMHVEYRGPAMGGNQDEPWNAMMQNLAIDNPDWDSMSGPTLLIAAMRAYIGSRFGAEVPDEVAP